MATRAAISSTRHPQHQPSRSNNPQDRQRGHQRTPSLPLQTLPASPTLTNPDMILPDYDDSARSSTPTAIADWKQTLPLEFQHQLASLQLDSDIIAANSFAQFSAFPADPVTPVTPILYGHGTMLSDIGEVTEVESSVGGDKLATAAAVSSARDPESEDERATTPTMPFRGSRVKTAAALHRRDDSIESTSTVTTEDQRRYFPAFDDLDDDTKSVADSNCQGDDEESMASSYQEGSAPRQPRRSPLDRYSTSTLSKRAEAILATAKKRLTNMEGNLHRARSSLSSGISTPDSAGSAGIRPSAPLRSVSGPRHSRGMSEDAIHQPSTDMVPSLQVRRAASALGTTTLSGGYRPLLLASKSTDAFSRIRSPTLEVNLEPLSEEAKSPIEPDQAHTPGSLLSPADSVYSDRSASRIGSAREVLSVQDLKLHMNDLKGKISSLREQTKADGLRRKSIRNMRTPSPFTHARQEHGFLADSPTPEPTPPTSAGKAPWNAEAGEGKHGTKNEQTTPTVDTFPFPSVVAGGLPRQRQRQQSTPQPDAPATATATADEQESCDEFVDVLDEDDASDLLTEDGYQDAAEEQQRTATPLGLDDAAYESEGGESLYHDTVQTPLSHEDREDAFDYEHFFLHSAMGSISQDRLKQRGRAGSVASDGSVETTRAEPSTAAPSRAGERPPSAKRGSRESVLTMRSFETAQSFATADDGSGTADDDDDPAESRQYPPLSASIRRSVVSRDDHLSSRPSVASFESAATTRSFPLINRTPGHKTALSVDHVATNGTVTGRGGIPTPRGSPDNLRVITGAMIDNAARASIIFDGGLGPGSGGAADFKMSEMLMREDQLMVERLVASLGRCVLGLGEAGKATSESRMLRRRIDAARRILDGFDGQF